MKNLYIRSQDKAALDRASTFEQKEAILKKVLSELHFSLFENEIWLFNESMPTLPFEYDRKLRQIRVEVESQIFKFNLPDFFKIRNISGMDRAANPAELDAINTRENLYQIVVSLTEKGGRITGKYLLNLIEIERSLPWLRALFERCEHFNLAVYDSKGDYHQFLVQILNHHPELEGFISKQLSQNPYFETSAAEDKFLQSLRMTPADKLKIKILNKTCPILEILPKGINYLPHLASSNWNLEKFFETLIWEHDAGPRLTEIAHDISDPIMQTSLYRAIYLAGVYVEAIIRVSWEDFEQRNLTVARNQNRILLLCRNVQEKKQTLPSAEPLTEAEFDIAQRYRPYVLTVHSDKTKSVTERGMLVWKNALKEGERLDPYSFLLKLGDYTDIFFLNYLKAAPQKAYEYFNHHIIERSAYLSSNLNKYLTATFRSLQGAFDKAIEENNIPLLLFIINVMDHHSDMRVEEKDHIKWDTFLKVSERNRDLAKFILKHMSKSFLLEKFHNPDYVGDRRILWEVTHPGYSKEISDANHSQASMNNLLYLCKWAYNLGVEYPPIMEPFCLDDKSSVMSVFDPREYQSGEASEKVKALLGRCQDKIRNQPYDDPYRLLLLAIDKSERQPFLKVYELYVEKSFDRALQFYQECRSSVEEPLKDGMRRVILKIALQYLDGLDEDSSKRYLLILPTEIRVLAATHVFGTTLRSGNERFIRYLTNTYPHLKQEKEEFLINLAINGKWLLLGNYLNTNEFKHFKTQIFLESLTRYARTKKSIEDFIKEIQKNSFLPARTTTFFAKNPSRASVAIELATKPNTHQTYEPNPEFLSKLDSRYHPMIRILCEKYAKMIKEEGELPEFLKRTTSGLAAIGY